MFNARCYVRNYVRMTCQGRNHTQQSNYFKVVRTPCVLNAMSRTIVVLLSWHRLFCFLNTPHWIVQGRWMKTSAPWHAQNSEKKKQYVLSQPCLNQLVKGRLLPSSATGWIRIIRSATPAMQDDAPFKRERAACKRECATMHAKSSWGYIGVRCPFPDASMAEHTVANTWTVKNNFLRVFYLP